MKELEFIGGLTEEVAKEALKKRVVSLSYKSGFFVPNADIPTATTIYQKGPFTIYTESDDNYYATVVLSEHPPEKNSPVAVQTFFSIPPQNNAFIFGTPELIDVSEFRHYLDYPEPDSFQEEAIESIRMQRAFPPELQEAWEEAQLESLEERTFRTSVGLMETEDPPLTLQEMLDLIAILDTIDPKRDMVAPPSL